MPRLCVERKMFSFCLALVLGVEGGGSMWGLERKREGGQWEGKA